MSYKYITTEEMKRIQEVAPSIEVMGSLIGIISTNYYDQGTTFHRFVGPNDNVDQIIADLRKKHPAEQLKVERIHLTIKH